jgi:hypothetical protein
MPIGYKYVERTADSQLNWAEIGKNMSDTFAEVNRVREEKKATYDEATRMFENELYEAPQGKDQDANTFTNNFAHDMIEQTRLDEKLFKSGRMNEREYTLKRQNALDGTKQLYEIQKLYQAEFAKKMEGITSGKLQALNIFNMKMVEGYGDFNNSKATINPLDNKVGIGLMETKIINGKAVKVLSQNIAPVNVIRGKILQNVETLDTDNETSKIVKGFGKRKDILYESATLKNAGTITEYLGPTFLGTLKDPVDIKMVNDMNKAINDQIASVIDNPYNLTSVLTENTGKYDDDSFTFDRKEADRDPNKILVKVDPTTQMTTIDKSGKNYKAQYQEASDWMRTDILRKIDEERTIKTTSQNQLQESARTRAAAEAEFRAKPESEEDTKPVEVGEILSLSTTDNKGKKTRIGVTQKIQNLVFTEGKGIENVATGISYNANNGTLELSGYQISGKEEEGKTVAGEGVTGKTGTSVVKKKKFVKNDINSAPLLSTMILKIPNPEAPGNNFTSIRQAKSYYKRQFESQTGAKELD